MRHYVGHATGISTILMPVRTGTDLHDLHDLRTRSLLFVHNLVESLRAAGVSPRLSRPFPPPESHET